MLGKISQNDEKYLTQALNYDNIYYLNSIEVCFSLRLAVFLVQRGGEVFFTTKHQRKTEEKRVISKK